jgi:membrane dipeptidase
VTGWTTPARAALALAFGAAAAARGEGEAELRARAERIHREALVVDGHNDIATFILDFGFDLGMDGSGAAKRDPTLYWVPWLRWILPGVSGEDLRMDTDLRRLASGGVDAQFFSIFADSSWVPEEPSEVGRARGRALAMVAALLGQVQAHPDALALATSAGDVRRVASEGRIAALMGLEGGHAIENDLGALREFHRLGVRYMTLTWNNANDWADSCYERRHGGLTEFGFEVVREMNRLGMIVDVAHVSDETLFDALELSSAPVIASHAGARALVDHPRNLSDEMLRAVARNGGVVMIYFPDFFIDPEKELPWKAVAYAVSHLGWPRTSLARVVDHVDHVARVAGVDHVGIGSDFANNTRAMPEGLEDVAGLPNLTLELVKRGYPEDAIRKILGENLLRVFAEVETQAGRLRRTPPERRAPPGRGDP